MAASMSRREVEEQLKALQNATTEKQATENVVAILKKLQTEVAPTEELLRVSDWHVHISSMLSEPHF